MTPSAGSETHTLGPWHVAGEPKLRCVVDNESAYIVDRFKLGGRSDAEHAANARLIAAAPDLLAACEESVTWVALATGRDPNTTHPAAINLANADLAKLNAAIRKAKGTT